MRFLNSLEAKFGHLAIPGLIRIVVAFQALVFVLFHLNPQFSEMLYLDRDAVMAGQVWRLLTFVFIPPGIGWLGVIGVAMTLYFFWTIGDALEHAWGSFRLNLFYFVGMFSTIVVAFLVGMGTSVFLNLSLTFAFATVFPNEVFSIYGIIPVKARWIGWLAFAGVGYTFFVSPLPVQALIVVSFANYLLFFGPMIFSLAKHRAEVGRRREEFRGKAMPQNEPLHTCEVCRRNDQTNPELDFRVSADGHTYCQDHRPAKR